VRHGRLRFLPSSSDIKEREREKKKNHNELYEENEEEGGGEQRQRRTTAWTNTHSSKHVILRSFLISRFPLPSEY